MMAARRISLFVDRTRDTLSFYVMQLSALKLLPRKSARAHRIEGKPSVRLHKNINPNLLCEVDRIEYLDSAFARGLCEACF
jgi:hypothetical protein